MTDPARPETEPVARAICARHGDRPDALLEILHGVQERLGFVPDAAVPALAEALNLSRAEVHGVLTFYRDFRRAPGGRHRLRICRAEACRAMEGERLARLAEERLGVAFGETSLDGAISLDSVSCLGNCALAPAAMLDERLIGRLDAARLEALIRDCRGEAP